MSTALAVNQISIVLAPLGFGILLDVSTLHGIVWFYMAALLALAAMCTLHSIASDASQVLPHGRQCDDPCSPNESQNRDS